MWLLPALSALSSFACRVFYRFSVEGPRPSRSGPLLLVANHQNSLFDPALVVAAAERPVQFLAKSTLFSDRRVGWLVRASGAIPVYRSHEVVEAADKNVKTFDSVFERLGGGAAIGVFPEGASHSEPSLIPLKTGVARIALGYYDRNQTVFPLVPIGLLLRDKGVFRSSALALRGDPVEWSDLAGRGAKDREAVRALTERLDAALREVTVNLERWEDQPLIETVEAIWTASEDPTADRLERVRRSQVVSEALSSLRRSGNDDWQDLADRVTTHRHRLSRLGLRPIDLSVRTDLPTSIRWAARRLHLLLPMAFVLAVVGHLLFLPPFVVMDWVIRAIAPDEDQRSTYKALIGAPLYLVWILTLAGLSWWQWGPLSGSIVLLLTPIVGGLGMLIRERLRGSWSDIRQFFKLKSRGRLVERLKEDQSDLVSRLVVAYKKLGSDPEA
jgi:glycerol-3-phosphate O-acyltransferase/dihydroxyacetone phosphate acyltransferase